MFRFFRREGEETLVLDQQFSIGRGFYLCPNEPCLKAAKKRYQFEPFDQHYKFEIETCKMSDQG